MIRNDVPGYSILGLKPGPKKAHAYHVGHGRKTFYSQDPTDQFTRKRWEQSLDHTYKQVLDAKAVVDSSSPRMVYPSTVYRKIGMSEERVWEVQYHNRSLSQRLGTIYSGIGRREFTNNRRPPSRSRSRSGSRSRLGSHSASRRREQSRIIIQENARLVRRLTHVRPSITREDSLSDFKDHCERGSRVSRVNRKKYRTDLAEVESTLAKSPRNKLKPIKIRFLRKDGTSTTQVTKHHEDTAKE